VPDNTFTCILAVWLSVSLGRIAVLHT